MSKGMYLWNVTDVASRLNFAREARPMSVASTSREERPMNCYFQLAKTRPVALTTGPKDFNNGQISDVVAGMREDNFARVQIFSWPNLGHAPPPADAFDRALTWIESGR